MSDLFEKALSDICGKVRVGGDDRRWSDLFSSNLQPYIVRDNNSNSSSSSNLTTTETLVHHFERLINHNPTTGNYVQLLDQAMARLRDISRKKTEPPMNSIETCCVSLYLCSIITHHFIARLEVTELRRQFFLPPNWPNDVSPIDNHNKIGSNAFSFTNNNNNNSESVAKNTLNLSEQRIDSLIEEISFAINCPCTNIWMRDPKFFCCDLLLSLLSTQLYHDSSVNNFSSDHDLFHSHLYSRAEKELRAALHTGSGKQFSESLSVQLIRGLVISATYEVGPTGGGGAVVGVGGGGGGGISGTARQSSPSTTLLKHLVRVFGRKSVTATTTDMTGASPAPHTLLGIGFDWLSLIPFSSSWRRHFTQNDHHPSSSSSSSSSSSYSDGCSKSTTRVESSMSMADDPLSTKSLQVLLILLHNRRSVLDQKNRRKPNAFRETFSLLSDQTLSLGGSGHQSSDIGWDGAAAATVDEEMSGVRSRAGSASAIVMLGTQIHADFRRIITGMLRMMPHESYSLLLYSLLQAHPTFIEVLHATGSTCNLLTACLQGLYSLTEKSSSLQPVGGSIEAMDQLYVNIVCLLMIVQDTWGASSLRMIVRNPVWYRERQLHEVPLVDLVILCLLRAMTMTVLRLHDSYLLSNISAIFYNLAPQVMGLLPYTAERVIKVASQLCQRVTRLLDVHSSLDGQPLLLEALNTILHFIGALLSPSKLMLNVHVLYALMHDYDIISVHFTSIAVAVALKGSASGESLGVEITNLTKYYLTKTEQFVGESNKYCTAQQIIELMRQEFKINHHVVIDADDDYNDEHIDSSRAVSQRVAISSSRMSIKKYSYQEVDSPEIFFVPAVWAATLRGSPEIRWHLEQMVLIDPVSLGFLRILQSPSDDVEFDNALNIV